MLHAFDLWSSEDVRRNAERIYRVLVGEIMPCGAPWPQAHKDLLPLDRWRNPAMTDGDQTRRRQSIH